MKTSLGTIEAVGTRKVWAVKHANFTRWPAEQDNIARMAEVVGLELDGAARNC